MAFARGKGRSPGIITVEQLAAVYYAIRTDIQRRQRASPLVDTSPFSLIQVSDATDRLLGIRVGRTAASTILKVLRGLDIIWKLGRYVVGEHGQEYACRRHLGGLLNGIASHDVLCQLKKMEAGHDAVAEGKCEQRQRPAPCLVEDRISRDLRRDGVYSA
jgi:hypothetical protein